ncbi:hypothetical protein [Parabacteroides sp. PM5-20]|uniref:hypothetical protein n=1 Tax=Parabacteroides sp. PM5-20 TaxID=2940527 RepID=UPI0024740C7F|nr:hypothetical protein [Parabacteroides sp. PM5-20]
MTIDSDDAVWTDAVIVDIDNEDAFLSDAIVVDESLDGSDFITMSDDTVMLSDSDMWDISSSDMTFDGVDDIIIL